MLITGIKLIIVQIFYDIVIAHGGEIKVETQCACFAVAEQAGKFDEGNPDHFGKGEGTMFIIELPIL